MCDMRLFLLIAGFVASLAAQPGLPPASRFAPVAIRKVDPAYTSQAIAARVEGTVTLYAEIGTDGRARNIRVVRSLGYGLDEAAVQALRRWRFAPATRNGRPARTPATIEIPFRLGENPPVRI